MKPLSSIWDCRVAFAIKEEGKCIQRSSQRRTLETLFAKTGRVSFAKGGAVSSSQRQTDDPYATCKDQHLDTTSPLREAYYPVFARSAEKSAKLMRLTARRGNPIVQ